MSLLTAPTFPSTVAEGKKGGGYDLKLSWPGMCIFLQFKLSHCMSNKSAKEFKSGTFSPVVSGIKSPVYRMYMHGLAKSRQTSLMLKLEQRNKLVYYVAPLFHLPSGLNESYQTSSVAQNSRFIRPSIIKKMPDQLEHFVSFRSSGKAWRFSDEPVELQTPETQEEVIQRVKQSAQQSTLSAVDEALAAMLETISEVNSEDEEEAAGKSKNQDEISEIQLDANRERLAIVQFMNSERRSLAKAEFIARTYFDAQMITLQTEA